MPDHQERPPVALARGATQSGDIERVRRDVDAAEECVARHDRTSAAYSPPRAPPPRGGARPRAAALIRRA